VIILGIETSCDETAAAVIRDDGALLSNVISSQVNLHRKYGGVVPELAGRSHVEAIGLVVLEAVQKSGYLLSQINLVAVTAGPGLIGALLVGVSFAKSLSYALKIPVVGVHHLAGHLASVAIEYPSPLFPCVALVVSGGHTQLYHLSDFGSGHLLGETLDDAAGEAFDKMARRMGYDYPGGPIMDQLAQQGNPEKFRFPSPNLPQYQFSFSGLKTAFKRILETLAIGDATLPSDERRRLHADLAAGGQRAIVESLMKKVVLAVCQEKVKGIMVVGGVAANSLLRRRVREEGERLGVATYIPSPQYCTDNAVMIAMAGLVQYNKYGSEKMAIPPVTANPNWKWV